MAGASLSKMVLVLLFLVDAFFGIAGASPFTQKSKTCFRIATKGTGYFLDVLGPNPNDGAQVGQWKWNGARNQIFYAVKLRGRAGLTIKSTLNDRCLTATDTAADTPLTMYTCDTTANQDFIVNELTGRDFTLAPVRNALCGCADSSNVAANACGCSDQGSLLVIKPPVVGADSQIFTWQTVTCPEKGAGFTLFANPSYKGAKFTPPTVVANQCSPLSYFIFWAFDNLASSVKFNWKKVPSNVYEVVFYDNEECDGNSWYYPRGSADIKSLPAGQNRKWTSYKYVGTD